MGRTEAKSHFELMTRPKETKNCTSDGCDPVIAIQSWILQTELNPVASACSGQKERKNSIPTVLRNLYEYFVYISTPPALSRPFSAPEHTSLTLIPSVIVHPLDAGPALLVAMVKIQRGLSTVMFYGKLLLEQNACTVVSTGSF